MTARVNLLPRETAAKGAREQLVYGAIAGAAVLLLVLGVVWFLGEQAIDEREAELAAEQDTLALLQAEQAELAEYAELEARVAEATVLIGTTLAAEVTFAGILQDLAVVFPPDVQLDSLDITLVEEGTAPPLLGGTRASYGTLSATGQALDGHAPGVERLLLDLGRIAAFDNGFVTSSVEDEDGIATYAIDFELGPEILTQRYVDATPEDLP